MNIILEEKSTTFSDLFDLLNTTNAINLASLTYNRLHDSLDMFNEQVEFDFSIRIRESLPQATRFVKGRPIVPPPPRRILQAQGSTYTGISRASAKTVLALLEKHFYLVPGALLEKWLAEKEKDGKLIFIDEETEEAEKPEYFCMRCEMHKMRQEDEDRRVRRRL
jgi:hypothetical protein